MTLDQLNHLPVQRAWAAFERCCGASAWVEQMCGARPYPDRNALLVAAELAAEPLTGEDWLEAFAHHPRIGDAAALRERFAATAAWAGDEQRAAAAATEQTLEALAAGNREYEQKFGYIFIVCATGKSADDLLGLLRQRMRHAAGIELAVAATEQRKITRLRLEKLLAESV